MKTVIIQCLRSLTLLCLPVTLANALEIVYFWGNNPTPPIDISGGSWVTPSPYYMSAAADARYGRIDTGTYAVDHSALYGGDRFSAAVLLKPYGTNAVCSLRDADWGSCVGSDERPFNTRFLYFWATAEPHEAYVLSYGRVDTDNFGSEPTFYQHGIYKPGAVTRVSKGLYIVRLGDAATFKSSVQVQHFDNRGSNVICNPLFWNRGSVLVRCVHRLGFPVDYGFRLVATSALPMPGHDEGLFDVATQKSDGATAELDMRFSQASDESPQHVVRLGTGYYRLRLGPSANVRGHVQVSAMDWHGAECHVIGWGSDYVQIGCTRQGSPVDSPFTVMGVTPYAGANFPRP